MERDTFVCTHMVDPSSLSSASLKLDSPPASLSVGKGKEGTTAKGKSKAGSGSAPKDVAMEDVAAAKSKPRGVFDAVLFPKTSELIFCFP